LGSDGIQSAEATFKELLLLSRGDLNEIMTKLKHIIQGEKVEDQLRKEVIDQGRKMNELRADHERQMIEQSTELNQKVEAMH